VATKTPSKASRRHCQPGDPGFPRLTPRTRNHGKGNIAVFSRIPAFRRVSNQLWPWAPGAGSGRPSTPGKPAGAVVRAGKRHNDLLTGLAPAGEPGAEDEAARGRSRGRALDARGAYSRGSVKLPGRDDWVEASNGPAIRPGPRQRRFQEQARSPGQTAPSTQGCPTVADNPGSSGQSLKLSRQSHGCQSFKRISRMSS
jgi:hypothetical protein